MQNFGLDDKPGLIPLNEAALYMSRFSLSDCWLPHVSSSIWSSMLYRYNIPSVDHHFGIESSQLISSQKLELCSKCHHLASYNFVNWAWLYRVED
jgi:hypothetical protein